MSHTALICAGSPGPSSPSSAQPTASWRLTASRISLGVRDVSTTSATTLEAPGLQPVGLFAPKPIRETGCLDWRTLDLASVVPWCPLAAVVVSGDRYSVGYSLCLA